MIASTYFSFGKTIGGYTAHYYFIKIVAPAMEDNGTSGPQWHTTL